ncbi:NAD(P)-dependent alcohol dehydrogenase [Bradyrhizobium sp. Leo121]|uniref:zinc-dependent alcohol dehydrogenase family protein n=1 Tax=Bradyrhizobium sp. Leo121 TaxID=1571195 RepID=UPI001029428E|nr:NAD(P)-dependent alcohol dehydrogenase [Bradyrhizobium sp. Leo121]RZN22871.1 NAD(P)-dependent alcohol dehydrogenase [Bradyrhizobium sp. Leo121]
MKAITIQRHGFQGLAPVEREYRAPLRREVRLRMRAVSLNYRDLEIVSGTFATAYNLPLIPISDGVGEVVEVGQDVARFKPGDRVCSAFWGEWNDGGFNIAKAGKSLGGPGDGLLQEQVTLDEQRLVKVPDALSDGEAAAFPCAGSTAWQALVSFGQIRPGDVVVVQGTGGVALFGLQVGLMVGAKVIVLSSSDKKLERAKALGAFAGVNYRGTPAWSDEVLELTAGQGADHILETGGPSSFAQSLKAVRSGGRISVIGYLGGAQGSINPLDIFRKQAAVQGIPVGSRSSLESLLNAMAASSRRPILDSTFDWNDVVPALERLHSGDHFGKIVLTF